MYSNMATSGQKRSLPNENESSDSDNIDEDKLLASDEEKDVSEELDFNKLLLSDEEEDEGTDTETKNQVTRGLDLREYQKELAEIAIRGENTIIYAATGAGKTRVAFYVIKKHLETNPNGRVAIMAEKTFLVRQHNLALKKFMPEVQNKTFCPRGQSDKGDQLHLLIDGYSIVILTPALIENTIKRHDPDFLMKFTLLVFDECHHTQKKSNYNRLMTRYHIHKSENKSPLPQIVGLTATLGTNKANNIEKAKEHALKVMANLDVSTISSVTKNTQEYQKCRKDVRSEIKMLPELGENDRVHMCIVEYMNKTEKLVCLSVDENAIDIPENDDLRLLPSVLRKRISINKSDSQYITWTSELMCIGARLLGLQPEIARRITIGARYLKLYSEVLDVNEALTGVYAAKALDRKLQLEQFGQYSTSEDKIEVTFAKVASDLACDINVLGNDSRRLEGKPISEFLHLLTQYCEEAKQDARFIVFVKKRETCEMLADLLKTEKFNVAVFTGASTTSDLGGTSKSEQENAVKQFNDGKVNGLIATNILEEGFDIPDCDKIFLYDYVGNEISTRQTAGRIRKQEGQRVVLSKRKDVAREKLNVKRGLLMDEAMEHILNMAENEIKQFIQAEQNRIVKHEQIKNRNVAKVPKLECSPFKIVCKKCGKFEVDCSKLRSMNGHHIVIDRDIWSRTSTRPFPKKAPVFDGIPCQGKLFGAGGTGCPHELGVVTLFRGSRLPFVSHKFFLVKNTETLKMLPLTKWADVPFHILELNDPDDLLAMQE